jgi:hypothetical protein
MRMQNSKIGMEFKIPDSQSRHLTLVKMSLEPYLAAFISTPGASAASVSTPLASDKSEAGTGYQESASDLLYPNI